MKRQPYGFALTLAGAAIGGFIGMMLVEGWWAWPFFVLAVCPVATATLGHFKMGGCLEED